MFHIPLSGSLFRLVSNKVYLTIFRRLFQLPKDGQLQRSVSICFFRHDSVICFYFQALTSFFALVLFTLSGMIRLNVSAL